MLKFLMMLAFFAFVAAGVAYLIGYFRFHKRLKQNLLLWKKAGEPDIFSAVGQGKVIAAIFTLPRDSSADIALRAQARRLRKLLLIAIFSFFVYLGCAVSLT